MLIATQRLLIRPFEFEDWRTLRQIAMEFQASKYRYFDHEIPTEIERIQSVARYCASTGMWFSVLLRGEMEEAFAYMPAAAADVLRRELAAGRAPAALHNCERAVLAKLRTMAEADFAPYDTSGEGLYHRLYEAVRSETSVEAILDAAKTKRYSHARLRRMVLAAWLGMQDVPDRVPYLRVLAANAAGRQLLRKMRDNGAPVLTKGADVSALGAAAEELFAREAARTDLYTLAFPDLHESVCGRDWRTTPVML